MRSGGPTPAADNDRPNDRTDEISSVNFAPTYCRPVFARCAVVMAVALALAGCGGRDGDSSREDLPDLERVGGMGYIDSLLYGDGSAKLAQEQRIREVLVGCMREQGFEYPLAPLTDSAREMEAPRPLVLTPPFTTYGIATAVTSAVPEDPLAGYYEALELTEQHAFESASADCAVESRSAGFTDFDRYEQLRIQLQDLRVELAGRIESDREVQAAADEWSGCMDQRGYDYDRPQDAVDDVHQAADDDPTGVAAYEQTVATADSECRAETGYTERYTTVALARERDLAGEHWQLLTELRAAGAIPDE